MLIKNFVIFFSLLSFSSFAADQKSKVWNDDLGLQMLERSHFKNDFYQLANFYQPQVNPFFCAVATSVIILNALNYENIPSQKELEILKPKALGGENIEWHLYSQQTFFSDKTDAIKKREIIELRAPKTKVEGKEIYDPGLALTDLAKILKQVYRLKVSTTYAEKNDEKSIEKFRNDAKKILADKKSFLVVNFDGKVLKQPREGHVSPLAAYDEENDSLLVLDVALHKNQWYWVSLTQLFAAMNTKDGDVYRGYLTISR